MIYGIESMTDPLLLPLLRPGVKTHYEGSIDKAGGNADYDWWLYQDEPREGGEGEWVLFDVVGPGCVCNFVQHRYPDSPEPTFRFYFDGEPVPCFTIRHSQFGEIYPFVEPAASRYIGPRDGGRGPIRVVRSFVPMPFARSCRITSDIRLEGFDRSKGEGGWGHVVWQSFPQDAVVKTFSPEDSADGLIALWKQSGSGEPLIHPEKEISESKRDFTLDPGESADILSAGGQGLVYCVRVRTGSFSRKHLSDLWVTAVWDGHGSPDVEVPFGCFFANELGYHGVRYLYAGMNTAGMYYNMFPMPYSSSRVL